MIKERYFKVRFGFGVFDFVSLKDSSVEKAIYAQIKGVPVRLGDSFVNGRNIISITPHYHKYTGWYDSYEPTEGEDWKQIQRDCPCFDGYLESYTNRVRSFIQNNQDKKVGTLPAITTETLLETKCEVHGSITDLLGDMPNKNLYEKK